MRNSCRYKRGIFTRHCTACLLLCILMQTSCNSSPSTIKNEKQGKAEIVDSTRRITLLFVGDLMHHSPQMRAAACRNGSYDYTDCFKYVAKEIKKADFAIGNLEVPFAGKPYSGYPKFSAPDEYLHAIIDAGFDVLLTANNHCLDRESDGLRRTINMIQKAGVSYAGCYHDKEAREDYYPLFIEKNGIKVALLNYTYGTNGNTEKDGVVVNRINKKIIAGDIAKAKTMNPDAIIAYMHWGEEYEMLPNERQRELANWLLEQGVTHIVGGHPHVVQPIEVKQDKHSGKKHLVAYSLGNFLSNQYMPNTDGGIVLRMTIEKDSTARLADYGYALTWVTRPKTSGHKVHRVYPAAQLPESLKTNEKYLHSQFTQSARRLFEKENKGIGEYSF